MRVWKSRQPQWSDWSTPTLIQSVSQHQHALEDQRKKTIHSDQSSFVDTRRHRTKRNCKALRRVAGSFLRCCLSMPSLLQGCIFGTLVGCLLLAVALSLLLTSSNKTPTTTSTATTTTTTTTTTSTTTTSTTTTSTTTTTSITTTSTSTVTTLPVCSITCLNQTWISNSSLWGYWRFENDYTDETGTYNGTATAGVNFTQGYVGQAVYFKGIVNQFVSTAYIPVFSKSFTMNAWVYPITLNNVMQSAICGICPTAGTDDCFHITFRIAGSTYNQYFGLYRDDVPSNTPGYAGNWMHIAITFDLTTRTVSHYRNGVFLTSGNTASILQQTGSFQIGDLPNLENSVTTIQGYIDELSFSSRIMSPCEILERATLAARFNFDGNSPLDDQGPNFVSSTASNCAFVSGVNQQAISFTNSSSSFFQASGFAALGIQNQAFSFSLWVQPQTLAGTLLQTSIDTLAASSCSSFLGFASNGSLIAQVRTTTSYVAVSSYQNLPLNSFTHIVQTWSSTNGLRLYINSNRVSSASATNYWSPANWVNYVTLGSCLSGCAACSATTGNQISPGPFAGAIDGFQVFSRELSASDVCTLFIYK